PEWQPQISAGQCIQYTEIGEAGGYKWNNIDYCNEVVRRGYASGVFASGKVVYEGGGVVEYTGLVKPDTPYAIQAPSTYNGKKKVGHGSAYTYWAR
ncbi:hypothetical protein, partial [Escherichia coli]